MMKTKNKQIIEEQIIGKGTENPDDLWKHQKAALRALDEIDKEKKTRFSTLINLPTGSGKTEIIRRFCVKKLEEGNRVLFIADKIALLEQTINTFCKYQTEGEYHYQVICGDHANESEENESEDEVLYDTETEENDSSAEFKKQKIKDITVASQILFASVGTLKSLASKKVEAFDSWLSESQEDNKRLYIIYDEAHHIGADGIGAFMSAIFGCKDVTYVKGVAVDYKVERIGLIGLTATVYRGDNFIGSFNAWFKDGYDFTKNKVVNINEKYGDYSLDDIETIRNNRIAPVDVKELLARIEKGKHILTDPDFVKIAEYEKGMPATLNEEMQYLADRLAKNYSKLGKTAVIVKNHDMVEKLCEELENRGITSIDFTSKGLKTKNRAKKILEFKNCEDSSKQPILVAISIFDEGIDVPALNTIYLYDPTNSQVVLRQRVGRVLRTAKGQKVDKRVIWQYYPQKCEKLSEEQFAELLNKNFEFKKESVDQLKGDIEEWKESNKKMGIPPVYYKEPLPREEENFYALPSDETAFKKIYGQEALKEGDGIGYFYNANDSEPESYKIYVRQVEKDSYMQFHRVLQNDWMSIAGMRQDTCTFEDYATLLDIKGSEELLTDIKKICFSLSVKDAYRKNGTVKNRVVARDEDIEKFFEWFISGSIRYKELTIPQDSDNNTEGNPAQGKVEKLLEESYKKEAIQMEFPELSGTPSEHDKNQMWGIYQKILEKGKEEKNEKAEMVKCLKNKNIDSKDNDICINRMKEYSDVLSYGKDGKYVYQDVQRMRILLKAGVIDKPRICVLGEDGKTYYESAFFGIDEEGKKKEVPHAKRYTLTTIHKEDWLLIASALVEMPNHFHITQKNVEEYAECVKQIKEVSADDDQFVKECLMALGYADNEDILRCQCKLCKPTPKILQYMVYEKIYKALAEIVCFIDDSGKFSHSCQNKDILKEKCKEMLNDYHITFPRELAPVDDVIYDYRPHLKTTPYYQGVKVEFLCRMLNDAIQLLNINPACFVDGFGGSGTVSMNNFYKNSSKFEQVYNDLGTMNTSFYKVLKSDAERLEKKITSIIEEAFSLDGSTDKREELFDKFKKLIDKRKRETVEELESLKRELEEVQEAEEKRQKVRDIKNREEYVKKLRRIFPQEATDDIKDKYVVGEQGYLARFYERVTKYRNTYNIGNGDSDKTQEQDLKEKKSLRAVWIQNRLICSYEDNANALELSNDNKTHAMFRCVEVYFHEMMLRCYYLYQILTSETNMDELKSMGINDEDLAVIFFFYNSLSHRHFYNDCTFEKIIWFVQNYRDWLSYGVQVFKDITVEQEDALVLLNDDIKEVKDFNKGEATNYNKPDTLWYLDIPYTSTSSADYVPDWFHIDKFMEALENNKGTYIVSSRCNICLHEAEKVIKPVEEETDYSEENIEEETDYSEENIEGEAGYSKESVEEEIVKRSKEFHVFDFFNNFVRGDYAEDYEKHIKNMKVPEINQKLPQIGNNHLSAEREAKYILISFTKHQEEFMKKVVKYEVEKAGEKKEKYKMDIEASIAKNNVRIDENYIRRMIASTHYSKIPVEVMVTNAELNLEDLPIQMQKISNEIFILPTFRTGIDSAQYMAEPLIVYMKYTKFMDILLQLLYKDAWDKYLAEENESTFLDYFQRKYGYE